MYTAEEILLKYWGHYQFRPQQKNIILSVLNQKDTVALMPTGGGKSICYQVPAILLSGVTLVISPLIALMQDQVAALKAKGINAAYLSAGMHNSDVKQILRNTIEEGYDLLYISPERIQTELFLDYLPVMNISLIAVDEAHCVSQWGHDFRPDYLKISSLRNYFKNAPIVALTASATKEVELDIARQLKLNNPSFFKQSFERKNINYEVRYSEQKYKDVIDVLNTNTVTSIVYCRSRKQTEQLSNTLQQNNINALPYHAGMSTEQRKSNQEKWMSNSINVIVATTAFGMGIDKSDVRNVIHFDAPEHLEAYFQESGRAGRDGNQSYSLLLYNQSDITRLEESINNQFPPYDFIRKVYQSVVEYIQVPIGAEPNKYFDFDLTDFCKKFKLPAFTTSRALKLLEQEGLWTLNEAIYKPTTIQILADRIELDNIGKAYPDVHMIITTLLRLYGSLFYHPTIVNLNIVSKHLKIKKSTLVQTLQQLERKEVIRFNQPKEKPQLFFHHYRVDSKQLLIDTERINALKKAHKKRTEAILNFIQDGTACRTRITLQYFGEENKEDCGHCDFCLSKRKNQLSSPEEVIIKLVTQEQFTTQALAQTLSQYSKEEITDTLRHLIDEGIIGLKEGMYLYLKREP